MKKILCFIAIAIIGLTSVVAQQTVTLTFTGRDQNNAYVRLDHVTIENLTRNWSETIWFPDTVYTLTVGTGVEEHLLNGGMQVMPNPFNGRTQVNIHSTKDEKAVITVVDINGRKCAEYNGVLTEGDNYFEILLTTPQTYILSVQTKDGMQRVKMVNTGRAAANRISSLGTDSHPATVNLKSTTSYEFELEDEMQYQGYALCFDSLLTSAPVTQSQSMDEEITLVFDVPNLTNLNSCEAALLLQNETGFGNRIKQIYDHEGNSYQVVQIGDQCWMKENLRTTTSPSTGTYLIPGIYSLDSYTGKQARWYGDSTTYAPMNYGLLYNWNAAVDTFNTAFGETSVNTSSDNAVSVTFNGHRRGICPAGWHLPSNAEWTEMTNYLKSQSEYVCEGNSNYLAKALADSLGWYTSTHTCNVGNDQSANNTTGFSAVPAGNRSASPSYSGARAYFWSSSQRVYSPHQAYYRFLTYNNAEVRMLDGDGDGDGKYKGYSVRCLRDASPSALSNPIATTVSATNVTKTSATLNGSIANPYYNIVTITAQGFEWKVTDGGVYTQVTADGTAMTYELIGLTANTSYTFRTFVSYGGTTAYGEELTFTTLSAATVDPTVSTDYATNVTETSATLNGSITNPDNVTISAQGFEWKTTEGGTYTQVTASGISMTYELTGLTANTSYIYKAFITYGGATAYGEELTFTTRADGQPCPGASTLTDYDGNVYNTVQIGNQCWMKENLRTTHYSDGTAIPAGSTSGSPFYHDYSSSNLTLTERGYLYNWLAVMHGASSSQSNPSGVQGICPTGWHVPSDAEWTQLTQYVSSQSDYVCGSNTSSIAKALASNTGWEWSGITCEVGYNQSTNNNTGFSAFPAGNVIGNFGGSGSGTNFWSSRGASNGDVWVSGLNYHSPNMLIGSILNEWYMGFSVRCLRD